MNNRSLTVVVWVLVGFALVVLGVVIHSRMPHRSADQQILIERSHQH
jgi:uncharacterized membrane protein